jgi:hypothetical protein
MPKNVAALQNAKSQDETDATCRRTGAGYFTMDILRTSAYISKCMMEEYYYEESELA